MRYLVVLIGMFPVYLAAALATCNEAKAQQRE